MGLSDHRASKQYLFDKASQGSGGCTADVSLRHHGFCSRRASNPRNSPQYVHIPVCDYLWFAIVVCLDSAVVYHSCKVFIPHYFHAYVKSQLGIFILLHFSHQCRKLNACGLKLMSLKISVDICCGFNKIIFQQRKAHQHQGPSTEMCVGLRPSLCSQIYL